MAALQHAVKLKRMPASNFGNIFGLGLLKNLLEKMVLSNIGKSMTEKYVIAAGDPITGYEYTGPFATEDLALEWAGGTYSDPYWWIIELEEPLYSDNKEHIIEGEVTKILDVDMVWK